MGHFRTHAPQQGEAIQSPRRRGQAAKAAKTSRDVGKQYPRRSATGHKPTHAPQQTASLLDHLVGSSEERWRHGETERFGSLQIDDQLKFGGLLNRQITSVFEERSLIEQLISGMRVFVEKRSCDLGTPAIGN
jgi:hypothetical protein